MQESKLKIIRDYIIEHSKFVFPIILIAVVAFTVPIALHANSERGEELEESQGSLEPVSVGESPEDVPDPTAVDVALTANESGEIYTLVATYYNAMALGQVDVLASIYDEITENERLRYREMAKYLDHIPSFEIYTQPGLEAESTLVYVCYTLCFVDHEEEVPGWQMFYVCDDGQGSLYIKNEKNFTEEEKDYIRALSTQADVVDLNNRVTVEYNNLMEENPRLLAYIAEFGSQVDAAIGVALAEQNAAATPEPEEQNPEGNEGGTETQPQEPAAESGPQYATATTTVNVRSSDSEKAEKLGKVTGGSRVQVQEVRVNGWTRIVYEGSDGYIKSEYLQMEESAAGQEVIGTVTAKESVNIRSAASTESARLGVLAGGESLELLANEGEWCKIKYNGKVGYVKAEFVTQ